jgi:hypothetical protein
MMINMLIHNTHKTEYQCFFVTVGEKAVVMDDNTGRKYQRVGLLLKTTEDNKLAPNQKALIALTLHPPLNLPRVINFHFGLFAKSIGKTQDCTTPLVDYGYNFHKQNVDAKKIMWP